ncbi:MAG: pirin family protein [Aquabacterium sp.]|jgi:redox-sensitive bicupin YhaK (pirin superfamily)|uniref:pirin family protein n=1 Tax=Aquabacterium sp. TaxID=1872578 RepID=UPI001B747F38|nr:pirin family protein [Aquabacterium sp.]MBP7131313.1 pirin family protein [Aquabacterium sp.]MBP9063316.1 pirin family protein [Aquabacterium sp.]MDQ5926544.1 quercetin 2,3-dioxygenase [Pseudomonadota bacterium]
MMTLRRSEERGHADHGWLQSFHSFSFAEYHDPAHMGFGPLRVINDDVIAPGRGFGMHGHRDMEIVTYVLQGAIWHKDNQGNDARVVPGEVQRMSAGTGILHSEFNQDLHAHTHLLQIWIQPLQRGLRPGYEQKKFAETDKRGRLRVVASPDGRDGSVTIHADATLYAGLFDGAEQLDLPLDVARKTYVHLAQGTLNVNGEVLKAGDALKLEGENRLSLSHGQQAEVLVFDLGV